MNINVLLQFPKFTYEISLDNDGEKNQQITDSVR